jgi:hypothetical protein
MFCMRRAGAGRCHEKELPNPHTYNKVHYYEMETGGNDRVD